jgi:hypothetical protein
MTELRRVTPLERMLSVLRRLASMPDRVWPVIDPRDGCIREGCIRYGIRGYQRDATGNRNWQYDSEALRARGLIKTGITTPLTPRRTGVRYARLPTKPRNLYLSEEEHAALVRVRRARGIVGMPNPVDGETTRGGQIETLTRAIRHLEELGEWTTVAELARDIDFERPDRLLPILKAAWLLDVDGRSVFDGVIELNLDDDDGRERRAADVPICVYRGADPDRPLFGTGLALLGADAYTLAETNDRLDLIDNELARSELPGDAPTLLSARSKLQQWQQILRGITRR